MKAVPQIIAGIPLFSGLTERQLAEVRRIAVEKVHAREEIIFMEGDDGYGFYILLSGRVKIFKLSPDGREQILHIITEGQPFGEVPVFAGQKFPANAQALVPCRTLFFPRDAFKATISANPALAMKMLAELSLKLRQFTVQVENLSLKEIPARLASYLIYLSAEQKRHDRVKLTISKGQLASLLGTIPETLSRIFARLSDQHLIRVEGRIIHLLDPDGIEVLAETGRLEDPPSQ
jgi:CRP/FNR family transcriptional regulator